MTKRVCAVAIVALLVVAFGTTSVFAAKYRTEQKMDPRIKTAMDFAFRHQMPIENTAVSGGTDYRPSAQSSLGDAGISDSPGSVIGFTWYELQKNAAIGRRVEHRGGAQIHMTFTAGLDNPLTSRNQWYNFYDPISGSAITSGYPTGPGSTYSGFGGIDAIPYSGGVFDTRAVVTGHYTRTGDATRAEISFQDPDTGPGVFDFKRIVESAEPVSSGNALWPIIEYHNNGSNHYIYLVAMGDSASATDPLYFFRKAGTDTLGAWEGTVLDTVAFQGYSITSSRVSQKVAVVWLQQAGPSANDPGWRTDIVYKESTDMGATWPSSVTNVTNFPAPGPAPDSALAYPFLENSSLYDSNDNLHIVWNSGTFTDGSYFFSGYVWHWADHIGTLDLVTKHIWNDLGPNCGQGSNSMATGNKLSIGECDGNLYTIWSQANDVEGGVYDDCANLIAAGSGSINYAGNMELWMSVSTDLNGSAWDARRNLTNSYNPACSLSTTSGRGDCNNDIMGTIGRYGQDISALGLNAGNYPAAAMSVNPDPSYAGTYYIDVTYINDEMPAVAVYPDQGPVTRNNAKWFRIPCVDPVVEARLSLNRTSIGYPEYTPHGQLYQFWLKLENIGNLALSVTGVNETETTGPSGWLDVFPTTVNVPPSGGVDSVQVTLNAGGVVNSPGTVVSLNGSLEFISNASEGPVTFTVANFIVADTVVGVNYDTISTGCIRLAVGRNGNMGNQGGDAGQANMDFFLSGFECDLEDTIPGDASVYLYDASPVILSGTPGNLTASWSIFQDGFATEYGFKPVSGAATYGPVTGANYDGWTSGTFVTTDSAIAVEKTWYAPTDGATPNCNSDFIVQVMKIYSYDGAAHNDLVIGEAMDWDVPSDSASNNGAGLNFPNNYIYLRGAEYDQDNTVECQENNARFGGAAFIGWKTQSGGTFMDGNNPLNYYGMYSALNADFVYPRPARLAGGFDPDELYTNMTDNSGLTAVPTQTDQHIVLTLSTDFDLAANDTLWVYTVLASVRNGTATDFGNAIAAGRQWYQDNLAGAGGCCTGNTGNVNDDAGGSVDLSDLIYFVNYLFLGGPPPPCPGAANVNGDAGCSLDLSDMIYLVNYLFLGGPAPAPCVPGC